MTHFKIINIMIVKILNKILKYLEPQYDYYYDPSITYLNIYDQYKKYGKFIVYQHTGFKYYHTEYSFYILIFGYNKYINVSHNDNICLEDFETLLKQYFKREIENEIRREKIKQLDIYYDR